MKEELRMIEKNQTWELVDMSKHKKTYWCKMGLQNKTECRWHHQQTQSRIGS
jgi:predicted RNA-binding Zn ribbon-like protein